MNITFELIRKELLQIFRNPLILKVILVAPVIQLIVLVYAANFEIKNLNMGIIDRDNTAVSASIKNSFTGSGYFKLKNIKKDYGEGLKEFDSEKVDIIVEIPNNLEKDLKNNLHPNMFIAINAINSMKAGVASSYISNTMTSYYKSDAFINASKNADLQSLPNIDVEYSDWFNPHLDYKSYMLPGILCVIVTIMGILLTSLNVVREKEIGTIEQLNVIPITKAQFITGKIVPFALVGLVQFTLGIIVAVIVFNLKMEGSIFLLYVMLLVYLLVVLSIGFLISLFSETQSQAMFVSLFCMFIFILMSGLFTPVESMPYWAQYIVKLNPTAYMVDAMRMIILKGSTFLNIIKDFSVLVGMGVLICSMIFVFYKKVN